MSSMKRINLTVMAARFRKQTEEGIADLIRRGVDPQREYHRLVDELGREHAPQGHERNAIRTCQRSHRRMTIAALLAGASLIPFVMVLGETVPGLHVRRVTPAAPLA